MWLMLLQIITMCMLLLFIASQVCRLSLFVSCIVMARTNLTWNLLHRATGEKPVPTSLLGGYPTRQGPPIPHPRFHAPPIGSDGKLAGAPVMARPSARPPSLSALLEMPSTLLATRGEMRPLIPLATNQNWRRGLG